MLFVVCVAFFKNHFSQVTVSSEADANVISAFLSAYCTICHLENGLQIECS